eukprot:CAMPEP_0181382398 /NCGR_PEP_ID=MMETSP1106-20121128/20715_1 /TAXON_ID=81844 /ORGANISM="Mantoniella antarctica, Strain SL-175" /LENGTH=32 /DNA_ID= /DNA_START= /DNA_END= /DNA_ORIENTATION=
MKRQRLIPPPYESQWMRRSAADAAAANAAEVK